MERNESESLGKLVFVYNADSGLFNLLSDAVHRVASPSTYPCQLCAVTHAFTGMRSEWKDFIDSFSLPVEFLHRDELAEQYGIHDISLPAVFTAMDDEIKLWIRADEINACRSLKDLMSLVSSRLASPVGL